MNYMSPERIENEQGYTFEGDIWSLGLVVYELAIGKYPFKESTAIFDMIQQTKDDPSPSLPRDKNFSNDLCDFIDQCLQKESADRPSAVRLLAHPLITRHTQSQANLPQYFARLK